jgi:hypothetical protein
MNRRQDCLLGFDVILLQYCSLFAKKIQHPRMRIKSQSSRPANSRRPISISQTLEAVNFSLYNSFFFFFNFLNIWVANASAMTPTRCVLLGTIQKRIRSENVPPVILFSWSCYPCAISFVDFFECVTRACQTSLARESWSNSWLAPLAILVPNRQVAGVGLSLNR